jgi:hypothetical protein
MDRPQTIVREASGGTIAAPVWGRMMARIQRGRRTPTDFPMPRGVVTETVDRATGYVVDPGCPPQGETYTEYFVHVRPPRPYCYAGQPYPAMAFDTAFADEELGAYAYDESYNPDTVGTGGDLKSKGITWPELEDRRRRGDSVNRPLPGSVTTDPPPGYDVPPPVIGRPAPQPPRPTRRDPVNPPPTTPAQPPPRTDPPPEPAEPEPQEPEPPVLGEPVQPAPTPPPDSAARGRLR